MVVTFASFESTGPDRLVFIWTTAFYFKGIPACQLRECFGNCNSNDSLRLMSFYFKNNFLEIMKVISESAIICIREYPCCSGVQAAQMVLSLNCLNRLSVIFGKINSTQWENFNSAVF